jgi:hypothetical protein
MIPHNKISNLNAVKTNNKPISKSMSKSLSLVWGVWRNGQPFDPSYRA